MRSSTHVLLLVSTLLYHIACPKNANWGLTEHLLKYGLEIAKHASEETLDETVTLPEYDFIIVGAD
jgi:hypothetical protein